MISLPEHILEFLDACHKNYTLNHSKQIKIKYKGAKAEKGQHYF